jgi:hypothetical protein
MSDPWGWYNPEDAVLDAQKNIFCVGSSQSSSGHLAVWCMTPDLKTRWHATHPDLRDDNAHVAIDPRGEKLVVWWLGKHSAVVLSAADGSLIGKIGGKQPDNATTYTLDMDDGKWLRFDTDGTMLALIWNYLARFDADGNPLPTWPSGGGVFGGKPTKMRPVYGPGHQRLPSDGVLVESLGSHPTNIDHYTNMLVGHDGRLYAERSEHVACWDRAGHRVYRRRLPVAGTYSHCIGADAAGNLYVRAEQPGDPRPRVLVRVSPDGKRVDQIAGDRRSGGVMGREERVLVAADGTIVMLRHYERMRVLGPDGRLVYQSPRSIEEDGEEERADAAKA